MSSSLVAVEEMVKSAMSSSSSSVSSSTCRTAPARESSATSDCFVSRSSSSTAGLMLERSCEETRRHRSSQNSSFAYSWLMVSCSAASTISSSNGMGAPPVPPGAALRS